MAKQGKNLQQLLEAWGEERASIEDLRSLAADLGNQHFVSGVPTLVQLLDHPDEIVRYNAVMSLAFAFHYLPIADQLLKMLADDPDEDCRRIAASALGNLFSDTRDHRVLAALGHAALSDPDEYVRSSAYKSLQIVNGISREQHLELLRDESLSVDPALVQSILAEIQGE